MFSGEYNKILNCTIFNCGRDGVEIKSNPHSIIFENEIYNNGLSTPAQGIYIIQTYNTTIFDNDVYENSNCGIYPLESDTCNITYNRIFDNDNIGIFSFDSLNLTITQNLIFHHPDGIYLMKVNSSLVYLNDICWNSRNGYNSYTSS